MARRAIFRLIGTAGRRQPRRGWSPSGRERSGRLVGRSRAAGSGAERSTQFSAGTSAPYPLREISPGSSGVSRQVRLKEIEETDTGSVRPHQVLDAEAAVLMQPHPR